MRFRKTGQGQGQTLCARTRRPDNEEYVGHQLVIEHGCIPLSDADLVGLPVGVDRRGLGIVETDGPLLLRQVAQQ